MSKRETVTCSLCGAVWTAVIGDSSYTRHYREQHRVDLEAERRSL